MQTQSRQKPQTKRQLVEDARQAAVEGRWEDAITINQGIIDRFPQDAEAFNRLGRAQLAFGNLTATHDAYVAALRIDPANLIARRNLQRLEILRGRGEATNGDEVLPNGAPPRTNVFIEEVGKTLVEELVEPAEPTVLAEILPGEPLQLQAEGDGKRLLVIDKQGRQLGEIDPRFVERVIELQQDGNRYEIYSLGMTSQSLRIILREVYRDPDQANKVSFPGKIKATRAYLRERDLLRQRDEADFLLSEEDDEEEEAPPETSDDLDSGDTEPESLIEEALAEDEEDQQM
jgi:hypothetical protein